MSESNLLDSAGAALKDRYDGILFDLDGVVYRGKDAVEHAPAAINSLGLRAGYVTNNASRSPHDVALHLQHLGINALPGDITTSALAAAALVARMYGPGTKVLKIGGAGLHQALTEAGLDVVASADDRPEVVIQGTSQTLTWADLAEGVYAINAGAGYIATNLDSTMPTERGMALGNGALVAAVSHATGVSPEYSAGKPGAEIFTEAALQHDLQTPLVIGDRLDTDIQGALAAGFEGAVVLTGVVGAKGIIEAQPHERPAYILNDLRGLHQAHRAPTFSGGHWHLGEISARADEGTLSIHNGRGTTAVTGQGPALTLSVAEVKAAAVAAWNSPTPIEVSREIHILD